MSLRPRARPKPRFRVSEFAQWITDRLRLHSPQREWLTILGVSKELIERVRVCLNAAEAIREGREPPKRAALPAERDSAEQSALAQLAAIVKSQPSK